MAPAQTTGVPALGERRREHGSGHDETPAGFLDTVSEALKAREGVDVQLAEIVTEHILTASPGEDCLEEAMEAINVLARARVRLLGEAVDD